MKQSDVMNLMMSKLDGTEETERSGNGGPSLGIGIVMGGKTQLVLLFFPPFMCLDFVLECYQSPLIQIFCLKKVFFAEFFCMFCSV